MCPQDATVGRSEVISRPSLVSPSAQDRNCSAAIGSLLRQWLSLIVEVLLRRPCQHGGGVLIFGVGVYTVAWWMGVGDVAEQAAQHRAAPRTKDSLAVETMRSH